MQYYYKRPYFEEDFIRGWARTRGIQVNQKYAEAFEICEYGSQPSNEELKRDLEELKRELEENQRWDKEDIRKYKDADKEGR